MTFERFLTEAYYSGLLALSLALLAIAILIYPQLKKQSAPRKRK